MIYLIGSAPRTGKSQIAQRILENKHIPYESVDVIFHMLRQAQPSLGITHTIPHKERAERFYPYLKEFINVTKDVFENYTIEGDSFFPSQVHEIQKLYEVKVCFLGFSHIELDSIVSHIGSHKWIQKLSDEELKELPQHIIEVSQQFKEECQKFNMTFFDLSTDYYGQIKKAYEFLI